MSMIPPHLEAYENQRLIENRLNKLETRLMQSVQGGLISCTSTTRPDSPVVGQNIYETDTGDHLVYYGSTTGWTPPWGMPWGYLAQTVTPPTTTQAVSVFTSTKITGTDTASVVLRSTRRYRVTATAYYDHQTTAGYCYLTAKTSAGTNLGEDWVQVMAVGERIPVVWVAYFSGVSFTGTLQLNFQQLNGTTTINLAGYGARMLVEDTGPASSTPPSS